MPEYAEVRIQSEFVNEITKDKVYQKVEKAPKSKVKTDLDLPFSKFKISSMSNGKQIKFVLSDVDSDKKKYLLIGLGMSGFFLQIRVEAPESEKTKFEKHGQLFFTDENNNVLVFHDVRRFGKWKWVEKDEWGKNRGPDPLKENVDFRKTILNLKNSNLKTNQKPISELLLNQKYFNGIGNYLRAEIVYRLNDINPWKTLSKFNDNEIERLINVCQECCQMSYNLQSPYNQENYQENIISWKKVYSKKNSSFITDKTNRVFWFDRKWNDFVPNIYLKKKHKLI